MRGARTSNLQIVWVQTLYWQTSLTLRAIARHTGLGYRTVRRIVHGELRPAGRDPALEREAAIRCLLREIGAKSPPFGVDLKPAHRERYLDIRAEKERQCAKHSPGDDGF